MENTEVIHMWYIIHALQVELFHVINYESMTDTYAATLPHYVCEEKYYLN